MDQRALILKYKNGYKIYMDILTGENLSSVQLPNMELIYCSVRSSSRRGADGVKRGNVILVSCKHQINRVHENLVQHPSNNIWINVRDQLIVQRIETNWYLVGYQCLIKTSINIFFQYGLETRLLSAGLDPVLSHTEKSCIVS